MSPLLPLLLFALQQTSPTTPPSGDTTGYWQQRVTYRIVARLDEKAGVARSSGELVYENHSPDTLREMYFHQYLNAFRPGSRWSAADARERVVRFQNLREPNYAYERFTATPTFDGTPVSPVYPLAPDSTVVRFSLPRPLAPGDSVRVHFQWDARPSATVYRRQGRRGRHFDFAQWYPKVAVYDRAGWEPNPLIPAGEFYGEFGTYDVTMLLPKDQVVGATGVPVEGDPGWQRVRRWGTVNLAEDGYGPPPDTGSPPALPNGYRSVRFYAKDVHHFAWTVSPNYLYEGALYRGAIPVHVLYRPGDEALWGKGKAVGMVVRALEWLESIYGPYVYPQVTSTHRLDGGATEFPMLVMYGRMSPGLVLHETGHIYTYGILANNEWRSAWLDEGLTDYQSAWAQKLTLPERARGEAPRPSSPPPAGYRAHAVRPQPYELGQIEQYELVLRRRAQPIGIPAYRFHEFGIYNEMVYGRASTMYGALRDVLGDSVFTAFLRGYYAMWKLKHVDERAMRAAAERASGRDLGWFFDEWVHRTGLIDYVLRDVETRKVDSVWVTRARIERRGEYRHAMPVGVKTSGGWVLVRGDPLKDDQWVELRTAERPREVRLDPLHLTEDWDRRNDVRTPVPLVVTRTSRVVPDWPFLEQLSRNRNVVAVAPLAWYTDPGGVTAALHIQSNYQGWLDRREFGLALAARGPEPEIAPGGDSSGGRWSFTRVQGWLTAENPRIPFVARPLIGVRAGAWLLDGVGKLDLRKTWETSRFFYANGPRSWWTAAVTATAPYDRDWVDARRWENATVLDGSVEYSWQFPWPSGLAVRALLDGGAALARGGEGDDRAFGRAEVELKRTAPFGKSGKFTHAVRLFAGLSQDAPLQRSIGLSSRDPTETFGNHLLRGRGALLARSGVHYVPLGGAGLRGYSPLLRARNVAALNLQLARVLNTPKQGSLVPQLRAIAFADGARATLSEVTTASHVFADAGLGIGARATLFDRSLTARVDFPLYVRHPELGIGNDAGGDPVKVRWSFSFEDVW